MAQQNSLPEVKRGPAERRQVTALSYDLVESTRLAAQLDPEDLRALQRRFHEICTDAIAQYEGYVSRYTGDGAMAYFGYPTAHEDDPERAIRAGLAILANCGAMDAEAGIAGTRIGVRVGIATGLVVAGDFSGDRRFDQDDVVGIAPNLAYKVQASAPANTLVITAATRELTAALFQCRALAAIRVSGFAEPQQVWQVIRARNRDTRSWSARLQALTPLVSRDEELEILARRWTLAAAGEGQMVLVSGEPGIGKSRLAGVLKSRLPRGDCLAITLQCSSQETDTALHPVARLLQRVLGNNRMTEDAAAKRLAAATGIGQAQLTGLVRDLRPLLDPARAVDAGPEQSAEQIRQGMFDALITLLEQASLRRPLLVTVEDAHWLDPTSEELLSLLVERIDHLPILVIVTFRPTYQPRWIGLPHVTLLALNRLSRRQAPAIVRHMARGQAVADDVVDRIVALADGVPLFLEEMSRTAFDTHVRAANAQSGKAQSEPFIPTTLTDSLTARLDRLGSARELAQTCSVIGRSFDLSLVLRLTAGDPEAVERDLTALVAAGLAGVRGRGMQANYSFKHALIQESAYRSMLRDRRQGVHRKLADILDGDGAAPETLAYHYEQAGAAAQAIEHLQTAAAAAGSRSANQEATRLLERALNLLPSLPANRARDEKELELLVALGSPRLSISGPGAPEVQQLYDRAVALCQTLPISRQHFAAHWGWWFTSRDNREALVRADLLSTLADELGDEDLVLQSHHCQWAIQCSFGNHRSALEHIRKGIDIYDRGDYGHHSALYGGHDAKSCGLGESAFSLWLTGHYDQSLAAIDQAVAHAEALAHAGSIRHSRDQQIMLFCFRGDAAKVHALAELSAAYARAQGFKGLEAQTRFFSAWARAVLGVPEMHLDELTEALAAHIEINTPEDLPIYYEMAAQAFATKGEPASGLPLLEQAIGDAERSALQMWTAELHRRRGVLLMQVSSDNRAQALASFDLAIGLAERQGARALLLRALSDKVRFSEGADRQSACAALAQLARDLTEGRDFTDLVEARRLLEEVTAS